MVARGERRSWLTEVIIFEIGRRMWFLLELVVRVMGEVGRQNWLPAGGVIGNIGRSES